MSQDPCSTRQVSVSVKSSNCSTELSIIRSARPTSRLHILHDVVILVVQQDAAQVSVLASTIKINVQWCINICKRPLRHCQRNLKEGKGDFFKFMRELRARKYHRRLTEEQSRPTQTANINKIRVKQARAVRRLPSRADANLEG